MTPLSLSKITQTAAPVCQRAKLGDDAQKLLRGDPPAAEYLERLLKDQLLNDAVKFLAQALPKREAIWWGCQCVKAAAPPEPESKASLALRAAESWVVEPTEERRRAAYAAGEAAGLATPAGCTTLAVFLSGGSMGPANVPEVPPAEHLAGEGVTGAIMLAAVAKQPEKLAETLQKFIQRGIDIASGKDAWPK